MVGNQCSYMANGKLACYAPPRAEGFTSALVQKRQVHIVTRRGITYINPGEARSMHLPVMTGWSSVHIPKDQPVRVSLTIRLDRTREINQAIASAIREHAPVELTQSGIDITAGFDDLNFQQTMSFTFQLGKSMNAPIPELFRELFKVPLYMAEKCPGTILDGLLRSSITFHVLPEHTLNVKNIPDKDVDDIVQYLENMSNPTPEVTAEANAWFESLQSFDCSMLDMLSLMQMNLFQQQISSSMPPHQDTRSLMNEVPNETTTSESFQNARMPIKSQVYNLASSLLPAWTKIT